MNLEDRSGTPPVILLVRAGEVETDGARAANYFLHAFGIYSGEEPWPDSGGMPRLVRAAAERGLVSEAREFADRMVDLADKNTALPPGAGRRCDLLRICEVPDPFARNLARFPLEGLIRQRQTVYLLSPRRRASLRTDYGAAGPAYPAARP